MLYVKNLSKIYKSRLVLDSVNLSIKKSQSLGIVGQSGSGKSTLARLILGLEKPSGGEIIKASACKLSVVFQDYSSSFNPHFNVAKILQEASKQKLDIKALLASVGLDEKKASSYPFELSGGQAQRVAIARAIATGANLIVLDEPLSALDAKVGVEMLALLERLKRELGLSYLFISHDLASVAYLCDRLCVLSAGRITDDISLNQSFNLSQQAKELLKASLIGEKYERDI